MRVKGFVGLAIAIALLAVVSTSAPGAQAKADRPTWTVGDYWAYTTTGTTVGGSGSGTLKYEVRGTESVVVAGTPYDAYRSKLWLNVTSGSLTFSYQGDIWNRVSDLAVAKLVVSATTGSPPNELQFKITLTWSPPDEIQWPLTDGKQWTTTAILTSTIEITGQQPMTTTQTTTSQKLASPAQDTTVTAGTFSTTPLRSTQEGGYTLEYWAPAAGNTVRETNYDSSDVEQGSSSLTSYRYHGPGVSSGAPGLPTFLLVIIVLVVVAILAVVVATRRKPGMPQTVSPGMPPTPYPSQAPMPAPPAVPPTAPPKEPPPPPAMPP